MNMNSKIHLPQTMQNIAGPVPQHIWALPATLNFIFGGTAAGYTFFLKLSHFFSADRLSGEKAAGFLAIVLLLTGFAGLAVEAGRPLRARYLARCWKRSWMSREVVAGTFFVMAVLTDMVTPSWFTAGACAMVALALLVSQAMMLFRCTAVPVWHDPAVPASIVTAGLAAGYSLILLARNGLLPPRIGTTPLVDTLALSCLTIGTGLWAIMMRRSMSVVRCRSASSTRIAIVIGIGQALALVLLLVARPWLSGANGALGTLLCVVAALIILAGNCLQKWLLVHTMQHVCGMHLDGEAWK